MWMPWTEDNAPEAINNGQEQNDQDGYDSILNAVPESDLEVHVETNF